MVKHMAIGKINIEEMTQTLAAVQAELAALKEASPPQETAALTESVQGSEPDDYKLKLLDMLKETNRSGDFYWRGEPGDVKQMPMFEAIGALSAGSAIPEVWAKDVFRCCPYPASAFWGAPFIKWHEDIHGKLNETLTVSLDRDRVTPCMW